MSCIQLSLCNDDFMNVCPGCPAGELAGVGNRGIPYCLLLCCISLITGCAAPHPPKPGSPGYGEGVSPVDDLLPGLYSTSLQERADTIHDIAATGEVAVVPLLDELIVADDDDRMWVAEVLVAIGEPVVEDVGELLGTLDPALDRVVMWILGRIGSGPAMQVLMTVVLDEYNWLRPDAIEAIGLTGSDEAISALIVLDEKSLSGFPNPISDELGEIGEPAAMAVIERLAGCPASEDDNCMSGRLMLSYIGASSLPLVLSLFESQDSSDRDLAAFLIEGLLGHDLSCGTCMQIRPTEIIYEAESFKVVVASKMIMRPWHRPPLNRWTWSPG